MSRLWAIPARSARRTAVAWLRGDPTAPKTFAVLCCLVTQAGQLVTKDALLEAVWPETVVSEAVVTVAMRTLRRVLGDQARTPRFIETVHGRGYRFIAPVSTLVAPGGPEEGGPASRTVSHVPSPAALCGARRGPGPAGAVVDHGTSGHAAGGDHRGGGRHRQDRPGQHVCGPGGGHRGRLGGARPMPGPLWGGEAYLPILEALGRLGREPVGSGSWRCCGSMPRAGSSRCRGCCRQRVGEPPADRGWGHTASHAARADRSPGRPHDRAPAGAGVGRPPLERCVDAGLARVCRSSSRPRPPLAARHLSPRGRHCPRASDPHRDNGTHAAPAGRGAPARLPVGR